MSTELVKADAVEVTGYNLGSLSVSDPGNVIAVATSVATPLAKLIDSKNLFKIISSKKFVYVEGWTTMGAMLGVVPRHVPEMSKRREDGEYEETVEIIRIMDGMVIGRAASLCGGASDAVWKNRAEYARKSMAITRATGKAFRLSFSWIMTLAGYMPTPAEEMDGAEDEHKSAEKKQESPKSANGSARDKLLDKFMVEVDERWTWFKERDASHVFLKILGAGGYEKAGEIPPAKRADFLKSLDDSKEDVKIHQETSGKGLPGDNDMDAPVTAEVQAEFEGAGI